MSGPSLLIARLCPIAGRTIWAASASIALLVGLTVASSTRAGAGHLPVAASAPRLSQSLSVLAISQTAPTNAAAVKQPANKPAAEAAATPKDAVQPAADAPRVKKALFIGLDGTRFDALQKAKTPQLDQLMASGFLAEGTDIIAPRETKGDTISGPGWSNLLCGVWPDKHGVLDNSFKGANYQRYPHFFQRIKEVRPELKTATFSTWGPIREKIVAAADFADSIPSSGAANYVRSDALVAASCATHLRLTDCDVAMLYLGQVDETGHAKGFHPTVPEYLRAIETVDAEIGLVLDAIQKRPNYKSEDWLIVVATDHGGLGTNHSGGRDKPEIRHTFMIVSGPSAKSGTTDEPTYQVDVVATLLAHLGIQPRPEWELDGRPVGLKP